MVQPCVMFGPADLNIAFLPYSLGCLWSYAKTSDTVKDEYELNNIIFKRDNIDTIASQFDSDQVVCFSLYIWNRRYCAKLARRIKERNPSCVIIYGGPEVQVSRLDLFNTIPYVDFVVLKEGEESFKSLLEELHKNNFDLTEEYKTAGLLINDSGKVKTTGTPIRITDLDKLPSPYGDDMFDRLVRENPEFEWNATLETNRGCPFQCTFCDWGSLTYSKIRKFDIERVKKDIEWMGKNRSGHMQIADANFGIFLDRDSEIADKIVETKERYGYPYLWSISWAKNKQKQKQIDIVKKLSNGGLTVSAQSMDMGVLKNIKRSNLKEHEYEAIFKVAKENNIPLDTELILGLPGETLETWKAGLYDLFMSGNNHGVTIYQAQILENTELNLIQKQEFEIDTVLSYDLMLDKQAVNEEEDIREDIEITKSTKDMPFEDMKKALMFNWFIVTFHVQGFSTYAAKTVNKLLQVTYEDFYNSLEKWFLQNSEWYQEQYKVTVPIIDKYLVDRNLDFYETIPGFEAVGDKINFHSVVNAHYYNKTDSIINEVCKFLLDEYDIDSQLVESIKTFTQHYIVTHERAKSYPIEVHLPHDIKNGRYDKAVTYKFDFVWDTDIPKQTFAERTYYQRRKEHAIAIVETR